jgi:hypothetical protein
VGAPVVGQTPVLIVVVFDNWQLDRELLGKKNCAYTEYSLLHDVLTISKVPVFVVHVINSLVETVMFVALSTATIENLML